jgi:hypothetical protein
VHQSSAIICRFQCDGLKGHNFSHFFGIFYHSRIQCREGQI